MMAKRHIEKYMTASTTRAWDSCIHGLVRCVRPVSSLSRVSVFPCSCGVYSVVYWVVRGFAILFQRAGLSER